MILRFALIIFVAAAVAAAASGYWLYSSIYSERTHTRAGDFITIEKGSSPAEIVSKLASEDIIGSETAAMLYLRATGRAGKLQAGEFKFKSPISTAEALNQLERGSVRARRITIPEGFTRFDIAKRIHENFPQEPPVTEDEILLLMSDTSLIKDLAPDARNLEGFMYPNTYEFPLDATPQDVINRMVEQFKKIWRPEWQQRAAEMGRTPLEIVTLASLIETESPVDDERPIVSSVIHNRLKRDMALGIDQTVVYVAKMQKRWDGTIHKSDIDADSPYNTRKYAGIPPGPISSVTEGAIEAALNPAQTDYLFYVLNVEANDGSHHFYASAAEFERGKAVYQRWLEEQRRLKREAEASQ